MNGPGRLALVRDSRAGASRCPLPYGLGIGDTQDMGILTDTGKIPADRAAIPDDELIGTEVWAALQQVTMNTFYSQLTRSRAHRKHDAEHPGEPPAVRPGDIPEADERAGNAPLWYMRTYRAWERQRPGQASSLGKAGAGVRGGRGAGKVVRLPAQCPHCHQQITAADIEAAAELEAGKRAEFARLREGKVPVADAAARLGLTDAAGRSWEMARRRAGTGALPEAVEEQRPAVAGKRRRAVSA